MGEETNFTQKLAANRFFGTLKKVKWVSYIELTGEREAETESFAMQNFTIQKE